MCRTERAAEKARARERSRTLVEITQSAAGGWRSSETVPRAMNTMKSVVHFLGVFRPLDFGEEGASSIRDYIHEGVIRRMKTAQLGRQRAEFPQAGDQGHSLWEIF